MKKLKVIIVLIGFMFSFNNQIFAIECDLAKFFQNVNDLVATGWEDEKLREEVARYSVCEGPVKIQYKRLKVAAKKLFDLENYEKTSGSKVSKKTKSGEKTKVPKKTGTSAELSLGQVTLKPPLKLKQDSSGKFYAYYQMKPGETLYSSIVIRFTRQMLKDKVKHVSDKLLKLNNIPDAKYIKSRQKIKIPLEWLREEYIGNQTTKVFPKQDSAATKNKTKEKKSKINKTLKSVASKKKAKISEGKTEKLSKTKKVPGSKVSKKTKSGGKTEKLSKNNSCPNPNVLLSEYSKFAKSKDIINLLKLHEKITENGCPDYNTKISQWEESGTLVAYILAGFKKAFEENDVKSIKYLVKRTDTFKKTGNKDVIQVMESYKERALKSGILAKDDNQKTKKDDTEEKDKIRLVVQTAKVKYGVSQINTTENGDLLVSGHGDGQIILWDVSSSEFIRVFSEKHKGPVKNLCINDSSLQIVSSDNSEIFVWNMVSGKKIRSYRIGFPSNNWISTRNIVENDEKLAVFSQDCSKVAYRTRNSLTIKDIDTGKIIFNYKHDEDMGISAFSQNSNLLAYSYESNKKGTHIAGVKIINIKAKKIIRDLIEDDGFTDIEDLLFINSGKELLTHRRENMGGYMASRYGFWSLRKGKLIAKYDIKDKNFGSYYYKHSMRLLDTNDLIYHMTSLGPVFRPLEDPNKELTFTTYEYYKRNNIEFNKHASVSRINNGVIYMGLRPLLKTYNSFPKVMVWELNNLKVGSKKLNIEINSGLINELTLPKISYLENRPFFKDNILYANGKINFISGKISLKEEDFDEDQEYNLNLLEDSIILEDSTLSEIWRKEWNGVLNASITFDQKHIISNSNSLIRIWSIESGKELSVKMPEINHSINTAIANSSLDNIAIGIDNGDILIFNVNGKLLWRKSGHLGSVNHLAFSVNDKRLFTFGEDSFLKMWNSETGQLLMTIIIMDDGQWAAVTPNGQFDKSQGFRHLKWRKGKELIDLDQFFDDFYTPGLLSQVYQTGELDETRSLDDALSR